MIVAVVPTSTTASKFAGLAGLTDASRTGDSPPYQISLVRKLDELSFDVIDLAEGKETGTVGSTSPAKA